MWKGIIPLVGLLLIIPLGVCQQESIEVKQESIEVTVEKTFPEVYNIGELVGITLTNTGDVALIGRPVCTIVSHGRVVRTLEYPWRTLILEPGESYVFIWDQLDEDGKQCIGTHLATIEYARQTDSVWFAIGYWCDQYWCRSKGLKVTTDKLHYDIGEEVKIMITNTGLHPIRETLGLTIIDDSYGWKVYELLFLLGSDPLMPGETITETWDQKVSAPGSPAPPGQVHPGPYTIRVRSESFDESARITIGFYP